MPVLDPAMSELDLSFVAIEKSEISSNLNAFILLVFSMGAYTVVYFGTMYIYFAKNTSKRHLVPATMTIAYLTSVISTAFQWYDTKWQFVDNGGTRDSVFLSLSSGPSSWRYLISIFTTYIVIVLADGLLIWRCFFVWNRSFRVISVSLLLMVTETVFFLIQIVSPALPTRLKVLVTAEFVNFISFATTLVTTLLIAYRIHSFSKQEGISARRFKFKHVLDIVVQSGAVYALALLVMGIGGAIPSADNTLSVLSSFDVYTQQLNFVIPGLSATIMVARVALLSANITFPSTVDQVSGLQFHARSTRQTDNDEDVDATRSVEVDRATVGGKEKHGGEAQ